MSTAMLKRLPHLACGLMLLLLSGCATHTVTPGSKSSGDLPPLIVERLGWMDEVARVKQARSLPVTDPKREAELLAAMEKQAASHELPPEAVRSFFDGQMEAAKVFQNEWLATHPRGDASAHPLPDLAKDVRPALDDLGQKMLAALSITRRDHEPDQVLAAARAALIQAGYSHAVTQAALAGLKAGLR
ncbi:gamma subclass chorismate mutase AroQ [Prosthecobacter sp. SYSU 5D2]|uniref:gamma subclass chorismate mutase AroQ n=1 Tax=Prosthecobacter sp. SYSU 5D2 TaxID=3134134 RepID=UPI0031FF2B64